jgi:hypothetical protein
MLPLGGLRVKQGSATWNLGTNSAFAPGTRQTTENLDRVGRSQDLPDTNYLLFSSQALNARTPTSLPICVVALFEKFAHLVFTNSVRTSQDTHHVSAT